MPGPPVFAARAISRSEVGENRSKPKLAWLCTYCRFATPLGNQIAKSFLTLKRVWHPVALEVQIRLWGSTMNIIKGAMISGCVVSAVMALGILDSNDASAADMVIPEEAPAPIDERMAPQWEATIAPIYSWLPGLNGTLGGPNVKASIDVTAWDLLENIDELLHALDGIYFGSGHIRYGNFGFFYDANYLALSDGSDFSGSGPFGVVDVDGSVDLSFSYASATLAGTYRFLETETTHLDGLLGAKFTDVDVDLDVEVAFTGPGGNTFTRGDSVSSGDHWVDAIVGLSGRHNFTPNWYVNGWALAGAGESDYVYDLMGGVGYEWNNGWSLFGGWRIVGTEYSSDNFTWDLTMSGPVMGLSVKF